VPDRPVILTCAINGDAPLHPRYPAELSYPITPAQTAAAAIEATKAGASVIHIHARDPESGAGSRDPKLFREIVDRIRSSSTDVVINLTCGHGATLFTDGDDEVGHGPGSDVVGVEERVANLVTCLPEMASLDITTCNQVEGDRDYIYYNPSPLLRRMAKRYRELGVRPELECFNPGDVLFGRKLIEEGLVAAPALFQFVLGVLWGAPADTETMLYLRGLLPPGAHWTAFGISRQQTPMMAQALILGGNIRVGLEDNVYLTRGKFATNPQLVERAVSMIAMFGREVATPQQAREILELRKHER
jgi:uncharacterized protein (DUF849 family)